jgi:vacuolar-type H+-ATPase subunit F/Vma7
MSEVAVIGRPVDVGGFALAGAHVCPAETADEVRTAWRTLPASVGFVVLTPAAAAVLADEVYQPGTPLTVVMP